MVFTEARLPPFAPGFSLSRLAASGFQFDASSVDEMKQRNSGTANSTFDFFMGGFTNEGAKVDHEEIRVGYL